MKRAYLLFALVALLPLLQGSEDDVVLINPDTSLIGQVVVTGDHFDISAQGARTSFKFSRIKSLVLDTDLMDQDWVSGQRSFWDQKWNYCYDRLTVVMRSIDNGGEFRPASLPFAYYYYAKAAGMTGHSDVSSQAFAALFAIKDFTKAHPLYGAALGDSAMLAILNKKLDEAEKLIPKVREADAALGNYLAAEVALAKNDLSGATTAFTALASSTDPVMKARAMMGATRVAIAEKNYDKAVTSAQAAIAGAKGDDLIQSDAQYYLGMALQAKAVAGKTDDEKASNLQKSAMAFMRVVAVYGNSSDKRILAADGAIQCFDKLASFQSRIESLKGIPYGRYSLKIKQWKTAQGAN